MISSERRRRREFDFWGGHRNAALSGGGGVGAGAQGNSGHCRGEDRAIMSPILLTDAPV